MNLLQIILISIVALLHFYFLILEMFFWTKPKGIKTFGLKSKEFAEETKVLAANQGLYNGFLATGLLWAMILQNDNIATFFLICIFIAGMYGAYSTKNKRIFIVQSIPALLAFFSIIAL